MSFQRAAHEMKDVYGNDEVQNSFQRAAPEMKAELPTTRKSENYIHRHASTSSFFDTMSRNEVNHLSAPSRRDATQTSAFLSSARVTSAPSSGNGRFRPKSRVPSLEPVVEVPAEDIADVVYVPLLDETTQGDSEALVPTS